MVALTLIDGAMTVVGLACMAKLGLNPTLLRVSQQQVDLRVVVLPLGHEHLFEAPPTQSVLLVKGDQIASALGAHLRFQSNL